MKIKPALQTARKAAWNTGIAAARIKNYLLAVGVSGIIPVEAAFIGSAFIGVEGAKKIAGGIKNKSAKEAAFGSALLANGAVIAAASAIGSSFIAHAALLPILGMVLYDRKSSIKQFVKEHFSHRSQAIPDPGQPVYPFEKPIFKTNPDHGPVHVKNPSIIVQIDGVSYAALQMAFKMGMVPKKVQEFFEKNHYDFKPFYSGQGCVTPSAEAGFLYGTNVGVPAFRFLNPETGEMANAESFKENLKKYLIKPQPGLLAEGSAYAMLLDGDAKNAMFVPFRMKKQIITQGLNHTSQVFGSQDGLLGGMLDFGFNLVGQLKPTFDKKPKGIKEIGKNLLNLARGSFEETIVRDATTAGLVDDIKSGVPIAWIDFAGYDAASHHYGPFSKTSLNTLRGIFRKIEEVVDAIEKNPDKDYHLYFISDHGQTPSKSFSKIYGKPLKQVVQEAVGSDPITIASTGSHGYVYFSNIKRPMEISEIEENHSGLIQKLLIHPGIAMAAGKQGDKVVLTTKQGTLQIKDGKIVEGDPEWLKPYGPPEILAYEIHHEISMYNSGHLVLYGTYAPTSDGKGFAVDFEELDYHGNHGSIGGHQEIAFIGHSDRDPIDTKQIMGSWDVHHQLVQNVTGE